MYFGNPIVHMYLFLEESNNKVVIMEYKLRSLQSCMIAGEEGDNLT